jgi:hypothetical protein
VEEYREIFSSPTGVPTHCQFKHPIELTPCAHLPHGTFYRCSLMENGEILQKGHIRPISFPCGSLSVLVQKKDGTWRICINYKASNKITIRNQYPIPRIDDLLDQLKGGNFFNNIYLNSGYHQVPSNQLMYGRQFSNLKKVSSNG